MLQRTARTRVYVHRRADLGGGRGPVDLTRYLKRVQVQNSIASGGSFQVSFKPGLYTSSDFTELDFVEIWLNDGRGGGWRAQPSGPISRLAKNQVFGEKPSRTEAITGFDARYYMNKHEVFFNPYILSDQIKQIVSTLEVPVFGNPSEIVTAWFDLRMKIYRDHVMPNGITLGDWIRFYDGAEGLAISEEIIKAQAFGNPFEFRGNDAAVQAQLQQIAEEQAASIPRDFSGDDAAAQAFLEKIANEQPHEFFGNDAEVQAELASIAAEQQLAGIRARTAATAGVGINPNIQDFVDNVTRPREQGRNLLTFLGDTPVRHIVGVGLASNQGPIWTVMESMADPAYNEMFFDTFSSNGQPPHGHIVFRPKPFWSFVDTFNQFGFTGQDKWSRLKQDPDFGLVTIGRDEITANTLGRSDQDSFTYWQAEGSFGAMLPMAQQQFMAVATQAGSTFFGRKMCVPIYEVGKAMERGYGLRRAPIRTTYIQIPSGGDMAKIAEDMANLSIRSWDYYFANHEYQSGDITHYLNTDMRIGRPVYVQDEDAEGYIESATHDLPVGEAQPAPKTTIGVTRLINWKKFLQMAEDRFKPGYLDDQITYVPGGINPPSFFSSQIPGLLTFDPTQPRP